MSCGCDISEKIVGYLLEDLILFASVGFLKTTLQGPCRKHCVQQSLYFLFISFATQTCIDMRCITPLSIRWRIVLRGQRITCIIFLPLNLVDFDWMEQFD
jgi:hypothetical protein